MKKINYKMILSIIKDMFIKMSIYFTIIVILLNILGKFFENNYFALNILGVLHMYDKTAPSFTFMLILASLIAGIAVQIFKIEKLPSISKHIIFFILLYLDFLLIVIPLSKYNANQETTLLLSVAFIVIYLVIFGIIMGIKAIVNSNKNKKLKYENQFDKVK